MHLQFVGWWSGQDPKGKMSKYVGVGVVQDE